ncbi:hypothetical protein KI387_032887, partial [Taxus chinensis]
IFEGSCEYARSIATKLNGCCRSSDELQCLLIFKSEEAVDYFPVVDIELLAVTSKDENPQEAWCKENENSLLHSYFASGIQVQSALTDLNTVLFDVSNDTGLLWFKSPLP